LAGAGSWPEKAKPLIFFRRKTEMVPTSDPVWVLQEAVIRYGEQTGVQSSVAAFNRETDAFLREVLARTKKPPIWAIQNLFDARHWQPEEKRREDERNQRERGKDRILEVLKEAPRAVLGLNLGLASW